MEVIKTFQLLSRSQPLLLAAHIDCSAQLVYRRHNPISITNAVATN